MNPSLKTGALYQVCGSMPAASRRSQVANFILVRFAIFLPAFFTGILIVQIS